MLVALGCHALGSQELFLRLACALKQPLISFFCHLVQELGDVGIRAFRRHFNLHLTEHILSLAQM